MFISLLYKNKFPSCTVRFIYNCVLVYTVSCLSSAGLVAQWLMLTVLFVLLTLLVRISNNAYICSLTFPVELRNTPTFASLPWHPATQTHGKKSIEPPPLYSLFLYWCGNGIVFPAFNPCLVSICDNKRGV